MRMKLDKKLMDMILEVMKRLSLSNDVDDNIVSSCIGGTFITNLSVLDKTLTEQDHHGEGTYSFTEREIQFLREIILSLFIKIDALESRKLELLNQLNKVRNVKAAPIKSMLDVIDLLTPDDSIKLLTMAIKELIEK